MFLLTLERGTEVGRETFGWAASRARGLYGKRTRDLLVHGSTRNHWGHRLGWTVNSFKGFPLGHFSFFDTFLWKKLPSVERLPFNQFSTDSLLIAVFVLATLCSPRPALPTRTFWNDGHAYCSRRPRKATCGFWAFEMWFLWLRN